MEKEGHFEFSTIPHPKNGEFIGYSPNPHLLTVENYVERLLWIGKCGKSGQNRGAKGSKHLNIKRKTQKNEEKEWFSELFPPGRKIFLFPQ